MTLPSPCDVWVEVFVDVSAPVPLPVFPDVSIPVDVLFPVRVPVSELLAGFEFELQANKTADATKMRVSMKSPNNERC
jgi:hypothetical protein